MIGLRGVTKSFGDHTALRDVSLEVPARSTTALIGPSGCGKSTLLRLMIGLITPDTGDVSFDGAPLTPATTRDVRRRTGYAIQSGGLFPHLTARRNVELPARRAGWSDGRRRERVDELASMMHMPADALDRFPGELSGGQRQRVALMRALVLDPSVLLLDEPLGALDPVIRAGLQDELRDLFDRLEKTVVLVTHDLAEAAFLAADDIVLMRDGRIEQRAPFAELAANPADAFVAGFVESQTRRVRALLTAGSDG